MVKAFTMPVTIIFMIGLLLSSSGCENSSDESDWFYSTSPDGEHEIRVILVGDTFTFGAQQIKIFGDGQHLFDDEIANDGKNLNDNNYSVIWADKVANLSFSGEEQKTVVYSIDFNGESIITKTIISKWM